MSKEEYKKLVSIEIKKFINKRIEIRRIYKELQQIKNNILYLKEKYGQEITEQFQTENGYLSIIKYKSEFSSRLKKEFKDLSIEEKRKLYKSGLLTILFRLNYSKYEKLNKENQKTALDEYVINRKDAQPYRWNILLTKRTIDKLSEFEEDLKRRFDLKSFDTTQKVEEQLNEIERERSLNKDYIEQKIENERQFYQQLADEITSTSNVSYFTDDAPYDLEETPENREKGILKSEKEIDIDEDDEDDGTAF